MKGNHRWTIIFCVCSGGAKSSPPQR